jgi:hypothetical protein
MPEQHTENLIGFFKEPVYTSIISDISRILSPKFPGIGQFLVAKKLDKARI